MKFCENCGNLLVVKGGDEGKFLYCRSCNKKSELKEEMTISASRKPESKEIIVVSDAEKESFPTTKIRCPKCGVVREAFWTMQQTRGGDEPPTRFYHCKTCNWRWREYS